MGIDFANDCQFKGYVKIQLEKGEKKNSKMEMTRECIPMKLISTDKCLFIPARLHLLSPYLYSALHNKYSLKSIILK